MVGSMRNMFQQQAAVAAENCTRAGAEPRSAQGSGAQALPPRTGQ